MKNIPKAGSVVATQMAYVVKYDHYSLVSDLRGFDGMPMLISLSRRTGTVLEESWSDVTQGKDTDVTDISGTIPPAEVLRRARSAIGEEEYSLPFNNCENFVRWAHGLTPISKQVIGTGLGVSSGYAVAKLCNVNSKLGMSALIIGGGILGLAGARALNR